MKKLILLSAIGAVSAFSASAQMLNRANNVKDGRMAIATAPEVAIPSGSVNTAKTTATGFRTYSHADYSESITSSAFNGRSLPIWQDSTIRQNFTSGLGTINFSSVAQSIYPFDALWNDGTNPAFLGQIEIKNTSTYNVDSVTIFGLYIRGNSPGAGAKADSLEITVASQPASNTWFWRGSVSSWAVPYLPSGKDTLFTSSPINVDSVRRQALSNPLTTAKVTFKVALNASDRKAIDTATTFTEFKYKLPTALTVPAGNVVLVSYTFRSGDTWVANVDTITQKHHFRAGFAYEGTATVSDKQPYRWYDGDHSMSSILFSTNPDFYTPTVVIGAINTPTAWFNQYLLNSVTMSCASCGLVGGGGAVHETSLVSGINAYPNPSSNNVTIELSAKEKSTVSVSIANMMGQVVATQVMGNLTAGQKATTTFNTSALPSGVYFYTVDANGTRTTNRFSIAH